MAEVETLGARLLRARLSYGSRLGTPRVVTQLEVAKELGVSGVAVGGWEADRNEPGLDNLRAIARFYGVRLGWLLEGELPIWSDPPSDNEGGSAPAPPKPAPPIQFMRASQATSLPRSQPVAKRRKKRG